jgi:hypothetical protein
MCGYNNTMKFCFPKRAKPTFVDLCSDEELCKLTLKDVHVLSSHNSYIEGVQHMSRSSLDAIKDCLDAGIRCIELDVFAKKGHEPIVAHGLEYVESIKGSLLTTSAISFSSAIQTIAEHAFTGTTDPLFLTIENNMNRDAESNRKAAEALRQLGPRLYRKDSRRIQDVPLLELCGKVVVLSGGGSCSDMENVVAGIWGQDGLENVANTSQPSRPSDVVRVYPAPSISTVLSFNYNVKPWLTCTFLALNWQWSDKHLKTIRGFFGNRRIKKKDVTRPSLAT